MGRCPRCLSTNIERYKTYLWKCLDCGQIFTTPLPPLAAPVGEPAADTAADAPAGDTAGDTDTPAA